MNNNPYWNQDPMANQPSPNQPNSDGFGFGSSQQGFAQPNAPFQQPQNPGFQQNGFAGPFTNPPQPASSMTPIEEETKEEKPQAKEQKEVLRLRLFWILIILILVVSSLIAWEIVDLALGGYHP